MRLRDALLEVLAPTRCAGCDLPGALLCDDCRHALTLIAQAHACPRCGAPFGALTCTECWQSEFAFSSATCLATLERPLSRCVTLYKDGGERRLASVLAELLCTLYSVSPADMGRGEAHALVPIPASASAVRRRGFDHTLLLAREVSCGTGIPLVEALARPVRQDQRSLGRAGRLANVRGAFSVRSGVRVPPMAVLLDDVMTTGATLDAAAEALLAAGATEVRALVLARAW